MADPEQLAAVIRFALDDLGARNAQHDFEHLCRHVARARIAANVLPATGPVAARGDQSRDFETFTTQLPRELPGTSVFATGTADEVVFACTTQQKGLEKKIKEDVDGIVAPGAPDEVHYFCTQPVDIGLRHQLQGWAKATHGVALEVHDLHALGQHLADPDLFWVAERYLAIPAELRPAPDDEPGLPEWYLESRDRWRARTAAPAGLGDLVDIKDGLRHATFDADAQVDLPFWLALIRQLLTALNPERLRQRARYEVAVATLRGQDDLRPAEDAVRDFFVAITTEATPTLLEDASVLLMYCAGAYARGLTDIDAGALSAWNAALRARVRALLDEDPPVNRRASLLNVLAHLSIHADLTRVTPGAGAAVDLPSPEITEAIAAGEIDVRSPGERVALVDVDGAFDAWARLLDVLDEASMFPVGRLAEFYGFMAPMLVDDPRYATVRDALDKRLAETSGRAAVADVCRRRALALLQSGRRVPALQEFHQAKIDWWSGDTLRGSLLAMLLISRIYMELRLPVASRYYALAAAFAASAAGQEDLNDLIPQALSLAAQADHAAGAWWAEVKLLDLTARAHFAYVEPDFDMEEFSYLEPVAVHGAMVLVISRLIGHRLTEEIECALAESGLFDLLDHMVANTQAPSTRGRGEWLALSDEQLCGRPFGDVGPVKVLRWSALGLDCTVRCRNRRLDVLAAERFAAVAQILAVELLDHDLLLMSTRIDVFVETRPAGHADLGAHDLPSNEGRQWRVVLTAYDGPGSLDSTAVGAEPLAALASILIEASLLPQERFFDAIEAAFERGLSHKLRVAGPYDDVAEILDEAHFDNPAVAYGEPLGPPAAFPARPANELEPVTAPGPTYSRAEAEEMLATRYDTLAQVVAFTLPRLNRDAAFRILVAELRRRGWLDWHLLTAVANIAMNYRMRLLGVLDRPPAEEQRAALGRLARQPETADMPVVPLELFTLQAMEDARRLATLHLVERWNLRGHQPTPDFPAITRVLADRYGYWTDDIPHHDPLAT